MKSLCAISVVVLLIVAFGCAPKQAYVPISDRMAVQQTPPAEDRARPAGEARKPSAGESGAALRTEKDGRSSIEEGELRGQAGQAGPAGESARRAAELAEALKSSPLKDVYFDFDSYTLKQDFFPLLKDVAAWMKRYQEVRLVVEGHCDERGTTDYNMALGQKRSEAVREQLIRLGVTDKRLRAVSFGKEMPADSGHTEESWQKNRRCHLRAE